MPTNECPSDANLRRLGEDRLKDIVDHVTKEFTESDDRLKNWKEKLVKWYDLYNMVQRKKNYDGLADIFVPEILRGVETVVTNLYNMIVGQPDWFEYCGRDTLLDDDGPAIAMTQLTMYEMDENNFKARLMDSLRQMVITGLTVRKIMWDYEQVEQFTSDLDNPAAGLRSKFTTIKDTWTFDPVDLLTFHISDVNVPYNDIQKADWMGEEYNVKKTLIHEKMKKLWFTKTQKSALEDMELPDSSSSHDFQERKLQSSGFQVLSLPKGQVKLIERWGICRADWVCDEAQLAKRNLEADDMVQSVIVIANDKLILKLEVNPFWHQRKPYLSCPYIPKEGEFAGIGAAQVGEKLQEEINDTRNQSMDNKTLILMTMWLKTRASGIKNQELRIRPNGVVTTNDIQGLVPLRPPIVAGVGTNMEGVAKNDLRESIAASSNLQGIAQSGVDTATESSEINKASMGRLTLTAQMYGELILRPMLRLAEYLNYQFYDHEKVISIIGPTGIKFVKIGPGQIAGDKDIAIYIDVDASQNPAVMRQQLMNFLTIVQQLPPQALEFHWNILSKVYESFYPGHKMSDLYPSLSAPAETLLTPEDERDCVIAGKAVFAQNGQDHRAAIEYLTHEMELMKWSLTDFQFQLMQGVIASHYKLLQAEVEAQKQQFLMQQAMAEKGGNSTGMGTAPNTTPYTSAGAPSTASLGRTLGG